MLIELKMQVLCPTAVEAGISGAWLNFAAACGHGGNTSSLESSSALVRLRLLVLTACTGCVVAMQEVDRRGVVDTARIAATGHSYGAFMSANLLVTSSMALPSPVTGRSVRGCNSGLLLKVALGKGTA